MLQLTPHHPRALTPLAPAPESEPELRVGSIVLYGPTVSNGWQSLSYASASSNEAPRGGWLHLPLEELAMTWTRPMSRDERVANWLASLPNDLVVPESGNSNDQDGDEDIWEELMLDDEEFEEEMEEDFFLVDVAGDPDADGGESRVDGEDMTQSFGLIHSNTSMGPTDTPRRLPSPRPHGRLDSEPPAQLQPPPARAPPSRARRNSFDSTKFQVELKTGQIIWRTIVCDESESFSDYSQDSGDRDRLPVRALDSEPDIVAAMGQVEVVSSVDDRSSPRC